MKRYAVPWSQFKTNNIKQMKQRKKNTNDNSSFPKSDSLELRFISHLVLIDLPTSMKCLECC